MNLPMISSIMFMWAVSLFLCYSWQKTILIKTVQCEPDVVINKIYYNGGYAGEELIFKRNTTGLSNNGEEVVFKTYDGYFKDSHEMIIYYYLDKKEEVK